MISGVRSSGGRRIGSACVVLYVMLYEGLPGRGRYLSMCMSHIDIWERAFRREEVESMKFLRWNILDLFEVHKEGQCD